MVQTQFSSTIKRVRTDSGGEYRSLAPYFSQFGILHELSSPHTPQQNGRVEQKNRHVVEVGLTLLTHASMPLHFWPYAFSTVVYLINRLPSRTLSLHSPFQLLYHKSPSYTHVRIFGCQCFPFLRPYNRHKLELRSASCVFLGYSSQHKGYLCLNPSSGRIYVDRHVVFNELVFPFATLPPSIPSSSRPTPIINCLPFPRFPVSSIPPPSTSISSSPTQPTRTPSPLSISPECPSPSSTNFTLITVPLQVVLQDPREQHVPSTNVHPMVTRAKSGSLKPRLFYGVLSGTPVEPSSFTEASRDPLWIQAMDSEMSALRSQGTWTLIPPSPAYKVIGCKWVYRIKLHPDGSVSRYKARLVAKGYDQTPELDFHETFSPVIKPTTVRLVISLVVSLSWPIQQLDIQNAFLHGDLTETVYMQQPPGYVDAAAPSHVCKLSKSIYGLKQSPRAWFLKLSNALLAWDFLASKADHSMFLYKTGLVIIIVLVYVDDIIITGSCSSTIYRLINYLHT